MKNEEYYYMDGVDKKGPHSKEEIIKLKLSYDTLIFSKSLNKWVPYQDIEEFKPFNPEIGNMKIQSKGKRFKLYIANILFLLMLVISACGIAFYLTEDFRKTDFQRLEDKANAVFNGKDEICDYKKTGVSGRLKKIIRSRGYFVDSSGLFVDTKKDNDGNELYEYYTCESGGWTILTLKKLNHGYDLIESYSRDMGFKVPESTYYPGTNYGYGYSTPGYSIPTYRGSIQNAYNEAMKFLSVEKENKSYVAGSYNRINMFEELSSDLHKIANIYPTEYSNASVNSISWETVGEASVYTKNWIVWYKEKGKHYEIVLNKDNYQKKLLENGAVGIGIAILIFLFWLLIGKIHRMKTD